MKRNPAAESLIDGLAELGDALGDFERVTTYEIDALCQRCGRRVIWASRDPKAPGHITVVCDRCSAADSPTEHANTGFLQ